jgi:hypothetical protein
VSKKLKLTRLTVSNLDRAKGGGVIQCFCVVFPGGGSDQACNENGQPSILETIIKTQCGGCTG